MVYPRDVALEENNCLMHWRRNPFDFGGAGGVTPVITNILFAKARGKKTSIYGKILGGLQPPQPPWFLRLCDVNAHIHWIWPKTRGYIHSCIFRFSCFLRSVCL